VHHYPRLHGRSEFFSFKHVISLIGDVLRFWWQLRRADTRRPSAPDGVQRPTCNVRGQGETALDLGPWTLDSEER
jgi:hypothetical protein